MAAATPLIVLTILLIIAAKTYMGDVPFIVISGGGRAGSGLFYSPGYAAASVFIIIFSMSVLLPVFDLIAQVHGWKIFWKACAIANKQILQSVLLAVAVALLTTTLAFFLAYWINRGRNLPTTLVEYACYVLFSLPATVTGIALILLWNRPETNFIYGRPAIVVIAHIMRFLPFALVICIAGLSGIDRKLEEVYLLAGKDGLRRLKDIILPPAKSSIWVSLAVCFILSLGEVGATLLVVPPGMETLPVRIYSLMHYGANKIVASLGLFLVALSLLCGVTLTLAWRRKWNLR